MRNTLHVLKHAYIVPTLAWASRIPHSVDDQLPQFKSNSRQKTRQKTRPRVASILGRYARSWALSPRVSAVSQHVWTAEQQSFISAQHSRFLTQQSSSASVTEPAASSVQHALLSPQQSSPFSQQAGLASTSQQALVGVQQASIAAQQSCRCASAAVTLANNRPKARNELANSLVNMESSPGKFFVSAIGSSLRAT
jgi:hypothetical protein